ncbi:unnamed protein product [Sphenostylis stenocarpa]|uniref:Uncharacterized protein n=1 Tax=Sphenostylis stenocarpa TaxID=92480 RepID=A0AA86RKZ6_9FABA|nr:unnamed protein product [Sphenostylis stenocarpa]
MNGVGGAVRNWPCVALPRSLLLGSMKRVLITMSDATKEGGSPADKGGERLV